MPQLKALLVDDSKSARFFLRKLLQKNDIEVELAENGEDALSFLEHNSADIIFMDHLMPGLDGFATTQQIKSNDKTAGIPVVMCTSNEGPGYLEQAQAIGAFDTMSKPPTESQLLEILDGMKAAMAAEPVETTEPTEEIAIQEPAMSEAEIIQIGRSAVQSALDETLEARVRAIVETQFAELKQDLLSSVETNSRETTEAALEQGKQSIQDTVLDACKVESKNIAEEVSREIAARTATEATGSIADEAGNAASDAARTALDNWQSEWNAERTALLQEAQKAAVAAAGEAAEQALAAETANTAALAEEAAVRSQQAIKSELDKVFYQGKAEARKYAFIAGAIAVAASAIVLFISG